MATLIVNIVRFLAEVHRRTHHAMPAGNRSDWHDSGASPMESMHIREPYAKESDARDNRYYR